MRNAAAAMASYYNPLYNSTEIYNRKIGSSPGHIRFESGIIRAGVRFNVGSAGLGLRVIAVAVFFRKYGNPVGNATVCVRKNLDDSQVVLGSINLAHFGAGIEQSYFVYANNNNLYAMFSNDRVSVEFPASSTDGIELTTTTTEGEPSGYQGQSHNGITWSDAANPIAMRIYAAA